MATVNKDFKVKNGLIVEGNSLTVGGNQVLTTISTTDDLGEGTTNLYFTDERAKTSATDLLTNSTQTNISITEVAGDLVITAENGVTDSTTDDLDEGTTNKYFTDTRVYNKAKTVLVEGTGVNLTTSDLNETITIDVDTDTIATKEYVDAATAGLNVHDSVKAATVENIDIATALENGDILDGVTLAPGYRVLVKDQTTKSQNGIYVVQTSGPATRALDYNEVGEVDAGDFFFVEAGTANNKTGWVQVNTIATLGSDDIEFTQFSGAGTYTGGTGINLDADIIELDFTEFDTDDINEGTTNKYYTDQRVRDVLTGSTQTNISITDVAGELVITAENGVDDATTDDLDEGTSNLYFTDQRAVDALEAVVPNFTAVEVNSIAKQVAATATLTTAEVTATVYSFAHAEYKTAKFLVKMAYGSHTEVVEVLLTLDTSNNIAITEYAIVGTNGSLGVVSATADGTNVSLTVNPNNASTVVNVFGTLLV